MGSRDDDFRERRRRQEKEDEESRSSALTGKTPGQGITSTQGPSALGGLRGAEAPQVHKLDELFSNIPVILEQLQNLYNQYIAGVEKKPPLERRKVLENLIAQMVALPKTTPAQQFRYNSVYSSYQSHKERWDRMIKDLESGKIRRG
jgi:hypothetical protein